MGIVKQDWRESGRLLLSHLWNYATYGGGQNLASIGVFVKKPFVHWSDENPGNRCLVEPIFLGKGKG
jgi:hypothetical protein